MNKINNQTKNATRKQTLNLNEKCNEWLKKEMVNYVDGNPENNALWCGNKRGSRYIPVGGASLYVDGTVMVL